MPNRFAHELFVDRLGIAVNEIIPAALDVLQMVVDRGVAEHLQIGLELGIEQHGIEPIHPVAYALMTPQQINADAARQPVERSLKELVHQMLEQGPEQDYNQNPLRALLGERRHRRLFGQERPLPFALHESKEAVRSPT